MLSIFISSINLSAFNAVLENYAPSSLLDRTSTYRDEEVVENYREGVVPDDQVKVNWYVVWYQLVFRWSLMAYLVLLFLLCKKTIQKYKGLLNCFCFTLLFWGVSNALISLPSMGRFLVVAALSALPLIIFCLQIEEIRKILRRLTLITTPAFILFIVISIRIGFLSLSVNTLIGNPLLVIFIDYSIPLNDLIKP
jgi:hypothetical protein